MPSTTSNDLNTSTKWDGSNETHDDYKAWVNDVSLWATNNQMAWIMKIAKRLQAAPFFRRPVSRAPPLRDQFLDEAQAAREELLAEIQRSAETDAGEDCRRRAGRQRDLWPQDDVPGGTRLERYLRRLC